LVLFGALLVLFGALLALFGALLALFGALLALFGALLGFPKFYVSKKTNFRQILCRNKLDIQK